MPTISCSITLDCGYYSTSEPVMILYYNGIDPVEGLTPTTDTEQEKNSPMFCVVLYCKIMIKKKGYSLDHIVKSTMVSNATPILSFILSVADVWALTEK